MSMTPLISIIMPSYNHADFIGDAIRSVLNQEGVKFEFLIADDGSIDQTAEIVSSFADSRINFVAHNVNRGACIVTNELIHRASGEYIALINSDDIWSAPDKLAYQLDVLTNNPDIGACFGRAAFIDQNGSEIKKESLSFGAVFDQENRSRGNWLRRFFDLGNCICHPTMLIRKNCYHEIGLYNNRFRQLPDFDLWIRLVKKYNIFISERNLINFRVLPGENASSNTTKNAIRTMNEHFLIAQGFFDEVSDAIFIEGFFDLISSVEDVLKRDVVIEKTLAYFQYNQWLGRPYLLTGLAKLNTLLCDENKSKILKEVYGIDDKFFQLKMGEIDVLKPNLLSTISSTNKSIFRRMKNSFLNL